MSCGQRQPAISPQTSWTMGHARIHISHTRQAPSCFPTNLKSTMTICPPTIHDPRQQLPTLHNATPFGCSGQSWPSMDGFSSSTPAQQGRLQIHSTLASPGQLSSLTQSSPTSRAPLPTALSHAPSADRGRRPTAGLPFPPAGWLHHPAISSTSPTSRAPLPTALSHAPFCGQRKAPNSWPAFSSCGLASSSCNQQQPELPFQQGLGSGILGHHHQPAAAPLARAGGWAQL